jgi:hypothetical protein
LIKSIILTLLENNTSGEIEFGDNFALGILCCDYIAPPGRHETDILAGIQVPGEDNRQSSD